MLWWPILDTIISLYFSHGSHFLVSLLLPWIATERFSDSIVFLFSSCVHCRMQSRSSLQGKQMSTHTHIKMQCSCMPKWSMKLLSLFSYKWICHTWHHCCHNKMPGQGKVAFQCVTIFFGKYEWVSEFNDISVPTTSLARSQLTLRERPNKN